ncbi:protein kinase domain-containing protein [Haliangium sp.]|uniref:nSTAND1 domain-containing NTPase n=1 Tax=Haliangium sp. TaxID=2663208 RepID=UPI003D14F0FE
MDQAVAVDDDQPTEPCPSPDEAAPVEAGSGSTSAAEASEAEFHIDEGEPTRSAPPARRSRPKLTMPEMGSFLHQYQLIRRIGRGGMGGVFLARDTRLGRLVALKFLTDVGPEHTQRLLAEARATARCQHENIVVVYEVGEHGRVPYMALEYVKGQTLRQHLRERSGSAAMGGVGYTPLPAGRAVEIMVPVVRALVHAHAMSIIHRDLKPENIMLTETGAVKVLDFGLAKPLAGSHRRAPTAQGPEADALLATKSDEMVGTLPYMSPEQILTGAEIDHRSDIWACGIMLFEMVTGHHPLRLRRARDIERAVRDLDLPMPSVADLAADFGPLAGVIDRCLIKHKEDRTGSAQELLAELEPLLPHARPALRAADANPFTGLASFQESHADLFFGRDQEIASAATRLRSQPLMAIVGPSGAGKSSLVRAGLIPALKRSGEGWEAQVIRPGRHPLAALASLIEDGGSNSSSDDDEPSLEQRAVIERLRREPGYLGVKLRARAAKKLRHVLVFIDQFEELYTLGAAADEQSAVLDCLLGAADDASSPLRVVLSLRSDFLDHLADNHAFALAVTGGLTFLPPIGRDGLREALTRPVEAADHRFESPEMVERMLDQIETTRGALPLLQFTAAKLWELRDRDHRVLDQSSYDRLGGVAGALASHADAVLASMPLSDQILARQVLERLVTHERTRAVVSMHELRAATREPDRLERVVHHLAGARLLVVETGEDDDGATVELIHESLIDGWPTLRRWLDEHREDVELLARLRQAAKQWKASGRSDGLLWRGEVARDAQRWHARYRGDLAPLERAYLQATFALATRDTRIKRAFIAGSMAFLSLLVIIATVALLWIRSAEQEATRQAGIVQRQLEELQDKERILRRQESELRDALTRAQAARREAEQAQVRLQRALVEEQQATDAAEHALAEARTARDQARRATASEQVARANLRQFKMLGPQLSEGGVRFNYRPRGQPSKIYLAGTFNGWNPNEDYLLRDPDGDGIYSVTVPLRRGSYQYKLLVDGAWTKDPNAPDSTPDGFGGMNGLIVVE